MQVDNENLDNDDTDVDDVEEEITAEATRMGWQPQDKFKGNKDKWVPAKDFVDKGKHVIPILTENNKRLQRELGQRDLKLNALETQLKEATDAIEALQQSNSKANLVGLANQKSSLIERLKVAKEEGDVAAEIEITEALDDIRDATKKAAEPVEKKKETKPAAKGGPSPEFLEWVEENPWFNDDKDMAEGVIKVAQDLRNAGSQLEGKAFFDKAVREYKRINGDNDSKGGKVSSGRTVNSGPNSRSKTFANLPADAKSACAQFADTLVGPNKKYKDLASWQTQYAKDYFAGEE